MPSACPPHTQGRVSLRPSYMLLAPPVAGALSPPSAARTVPRSRGCRAQAAPRRGPPGAGSALPRAPPVRPRPLGYPLPPPKTRSTSASLRCSGVRADPSAISSDIRPDLPYGPFGHIIDTQANSHEDPPLADPLNFGEFTFHALC